MKASLAHVLAAHQPGHAAPAPALSPATRALLTSNGYLAPGPKTAAPAGADPKDKLPEFREYEDAQLALYHGRPAEAAVILRKILAADPGNSLARRDLGGIYLELKSYDHARAELEKVAAVAPDDYVTQYQLGLILENQKLYEQAAAHLQIACGIAPDSVPCRNELKAVQEKSPRRP